MGWGHALGVLALHAFLGQVLPTFNLASCWDNFAIILESSWAELVILLAWSWDDFGIRLVGLLSEYVLYLFVVGQAYVHLLNAFTFAMILLLCCFHVGDTNI